MARTDRLLRMLPGPLASWMYRRLRRRPAVERRLDAEFAAILGEAAGATGGARLPAIGLGAAAVLEQIAAASGGAERRAAAGFASGAVYHGDPDHEDLMNRAYALQSQSNPMHADLWPATVRFEAEIVAMTAAMLHAPGAVGTVTSGGTESILLAMKAYRDRARERGIRRPQMVLPVTAHAAFLKAGALFGLETVPIAVDGSYRADADAAGAAIGRRTAVVVGSAPSFPHGTIDPIEALAAAAAHRGVGMHVDACLGGFVLPWAERLGRAVPPFDFRVPGVTSMSADTHKYGYAAKGTSVVLYRDRRLRRHQYFTTADWPGGLYASPTLAGSRPGGLVAACWAAMMATGEQGYLDATRSILEAADRVRAGIAAIPGLRVLGDPLWVIAFAADGVDVYRVLEEMTARGWSLNGLLHPPAVHLAITLRHTQPGVVERFLDDLAGSVLAARQADADPGRPAPMYGTAASFPVRAAVDDLLARYLDGLYDLPC